LIVKGRPSGDLFFDLATEYPDQDLLSLNFLRNQIAVMSPRLMSDLLVNKCYDFAKPPRLSGFLRYVLGDGLIIVEEDQHKFLRKHTTPAFHYRHIKELYPMMWVRGDILTKTLAKQPTADNGGAILIELGSWASKVTLDIIGIAGLGRNLNTVETQVDPLATIYEELLDPDREKLIFAMLCFAFGREAVRWIPTRVNKLFNHLTSSLDNICRPMIHEKKIAISEKGDEHFDILSLLIKSGTFTDEALKDQLLTFLAAGYVFLNIV
jgi:cytochrome P450